MTYEWHKLYGTNQWTIIGHVSQCVRMAVSQTRHSAVILSDSPHGRDGVTEDAAEPPVSERLEGASHALVVGGAAAGAVVGGTVHTQALQAVPEHGAQSEV